MVNSLVLAGLLLLATISSAAGIDLGEPNVKAALKGEWYCHKVVAINDASPQDSLNGFLRFTFEKNLLYISLAPFDKGFKFQIQIADESFFLIAPDRSKIEYKIDSLNSNSLILTSKHQTGELLTYYFARNDFEEGRMGENEAYEHYQIGIVLHLDPFLKVNNKAYTYLVSSDQRRLPFEFKAPNSHNFASLFLTFFDEKLISEIDNSVNEIEVTIKISKKGLVSIKIEKGISYKINSHVFDILTKTGRYWKLMNDHNETIEFRLSFIMKNKTS